MKLQQKATKADLSSQVFLGIYLRTVRQEVLTNLIRNMCLKTTHIQGDNQ